MKPTLLKFLTALLLAPLAVLDAAPSTDARIVIASEAGAHLDSDVNKGGGTDDTALIQAILDRAPKLGALKLVGVPFGTHKLSEVSEEAREGILVLRHLASESMRDAGFRATQTLQSR